MVQYKPLLESTPRYMRATLSSAKKQRSEPGVQVDSTELEEGVSGLEALFGKASELSQHQLDESDMCSSTVSEEDLSFDAKSEDAWGREPLFSEDELTVEWIVGLGGVPCTEEERRFFSEILEGLHCLEPITIWYDMQEWKEEEEISFVQGLSEAASSLAQCYGQALELSQHSLPPHEDVQVWYETKPWTSEEEVSVVENVEEGVSGLEEIHGEALELSQHTLDGSTTSGEPKNVSETPRKPFREARLPGYLRQTKSSARRKRPKIRFSRCQAQACA